MMWSGTWGSSSEQPLRMVRPKPASSSRVAGKRRASSHPSAVLAGSAWATAARRISSSLPSRSTANQSASSGTMMAPRLRSVTSVSSDWSMRALASARNDARRSTRLRSVISCTTVPTPVTSPPRPMRTG